MTRLSFYSLVIGFFSGCILGGFMCYIALQHNPQMIYTDDPKNLIPIFLVHAAVVFFPFGIFSIVREFYFVFIKRKNMQNKQDNEKTAGT